MDYCLELINLAEHSPIKEPYVIGEYDLSVIKNSKEANLVEKLLIEKGKIIESRVVTRAKELVKEISDLVDIAIRIIPRIQGKPEVITESEQKMWHAGQSVAGKGEDLILS